MTRALIHLNEQTQITNWLCFENRASDIRWDLSTIISPSTFRSPRTRTLLKSLTSWVVRSPITSNSQLELPWPRPLTLRMSLSSTELIMLLFLLHAPGSTRLAASVIRTIESSSMVSSSPRRPSSSLRTEINEYTLINNTMQHRGFRISWTVTVDYFNLKFTHRLARFKSKRTFIGEFVWCNHYSILFENWTNGWWNFD